MTRKRGRWSHPVLSTPGSRLLDIYVELPEGQASLFRVNEVIGRYETVTLLERTKYLPDRRGVWDLVSYEALVWVSRDQLRPFQEELSSLRQDGFKVTVADIMTTPEPADSEPEGGPGRRWVNS
ncbi:MAG: hypothetical protein ABIJ47_01585 [Candidatus Bathyarchaeota archaeon]